MPRFFLDFDGGERAAITGADARHIAGALRMRPGEELTLCNGRGDDFACVIESASTDRVELKVLYKAPTASEPTLRVTLYQGLPKGDKLEWIIQKAVELGVSAIVPVVTRRSVARADGKEEKKRQRWQRIADEAAGQSGRGILPAVSAPIPFREALTRLEKENTLVFYEGGGAPLRELVSPDTRELSILVGPEGGFEKEEVEAVLAAGGRAATLGKRILRCETAPVAALSALMLLSGNME